MPIFANIYGEQLNFDIKIIVILCHFQKCIKDD